MRLKNIIRSIGKFVLNRIFLLTVLFMALFLYLGRALYQIQILDADLYKEKIYKNTETISQHNLATLEIVSRFVRFCTNNSLDFNEISGYSQNIYEKVSQMDESSLTNWTVNMSMAISDCLMNARNNTSKRLIVDAQNIVKDRYMEADISLDEVCAQLGVSNSYFSSIFKKEVGKSFISYLTDYRMDIAEDLVLNTDEKSYTIAEKVGYLDANYFSYVFKKKFGVSPSKYRASAKK